MFVFENLNHALQGMSARLLQFGVKRETRGFTCYELPEPVLICINNPTDRYVTIPERNWNGVLPFAESLWLALGLNDLNSLPGHYVKNLYNFSDDGRTWRAGYGPRLRGFTGHDQDYDVSNPDEAHCYSGMINRTDQLKFVIETLKKDPNSRQALITIHDPAKDDFDSKGELKVTKDQPCTRSIHFQISVDGELDCIVDMRSNDVLWGFSAVNVFNFTFMQEYVANILGLKVGRYFHKADNFHYYENFQEKLGDIADTNSLSAKKSEKFQYQSKFKSLADFDFKLKELYLYEKMLREDGYTNLVNLQHDMMDDWALVFYIKWTGDRDVKFKNPHLNTLFKL